MPLPAPATPHVHDLNLERRDDRGEVLGPPDRKLARMLLVKIHENDANPEHCPENNWADGDGMDGVVDRKLALLSRTRATHRWLLR